MEGAEAEMMDDQEEPEDEDANMNYREPTGQMNEQDDEENVQDPLAAAGLEDSDADKEVVNYLYKSKDTNLSILSPHDMDSKDLDWMSWCLGINEVFME